MIGQKNVTTFGIQFKPIVPSKFFNSGEEQVVQDYLTVNYKPRIGFNFGMVMRQGFTDVISLEAGINMVRRNYDLTARDTDLGMDLKLNFAFVGYEVPVLGLIYVKLGERLWMNGAGGVSFDFYPTSVFNLVSDVQDTIFFDFEQFTSRRHWMQVALLANYGFEYRTKTKGYWYLGISYHRPFDDVATTRATLIRDNIPLSVYNNLSGSYLTIDLRYFFHEKVEKTMKTRSGPK